MPYHLPRKLRVRLARLQRRPPPLWRVTLFAVALYAGVMFLVTRGRICTPEEMANGTCKPKVATHAPATPLREEDALTDMQPDGGATPGGRRIPEKPADWQKRPPCDEDSGEEAINGACYGAMKRKPPCGPKMVQHGDTCYRAVAKAPKPPTSIER